AVVSVGFRIHGDFHRAALPGDPNRSLFGAGSEERTISRSQTRGVNGKSDGVVPVHFLAAFAHHGGTHLVHQLQYGAHSKPHRDVAQLPSPAVAVRAHSVYRLRRVCLSVPHAIDTAIHRLWG